MGMGLGRATVALFASSVVLSLLWVRAELRAPEPMVDMRMMAKRTVLFTNLTAIFTGFAMFGAFVLLPSLMQTDRDVGSPLRLRAVADGDRPLPAAGRGARVRRRPAARGGSARATARACR